MMEKKQIAQVLHETGVLLELKGENPFKVRAYINAARTVEMLDEDIRELVASGAVKTIKGIGAKLSEHIAELVTTGELSFYRELRAGIPGGLLDLLKVPGLGPKKIYALHQALDVESIADLEYACHENRLVSLKGFGKKSQENVLQGIEYIKKFQGQYLISEARTEAEKLFSALKACGLLKDLSIAGSLRRSKELVKDIDIVAASADAPGVMDFFAALPHIADILGRGDTKTSVRLDSGINADLRVVSPEQFHYALAHFTGSKEHNTALRQRAKKMGFKLNEYGLFSAAGTLPAHCEGDLFTGLGLAYIPPELREDMGEIEAADKDMLPELVTLNDITGVFHVHTTYSDGMHSLAEMAGEAQKAGFSYLGISDHSQTASYAGGLKIDAVKRQNEEIRARNKANPDFYVFHGIESDIHSDGSLDYPDDILALFDFVIASVHSGFSIAGDRATRRLITAMENPFVTMLGHPTGRILLGRRGYDPDMKRVIQAARANNVIIELNASPFRLDIDWRHIKYAKQQGVIISINPDAHSKEDLYETGYGVSMARKGWLEKDDVFNTWDREKIMSHFAQKRNRT